MNEAQKFKRWLADQGIDTSDPRVADMEFGWMARAQVPPEPVAPPLPPLEDKRGS